MEDVTDPAFRLLCKRFGADMVYTEFVSSDALIRNVKRTEQKLILNDEERPVAIQLYGKDAETMAEAARIAESANPDIIDINFGCPVKKVAGKGAGAGLLKDIPKMLEMYKGKTDLLEITIYDTFNPYDCIFATEIGRTSFESQASVLYDEGKISLWDSFSESKDASTLYHEYSHLIQRELLKQNPSLESEWKEAVENDGVYITDYAKESLSEDFAETLGIYTNGNQLEVASKFIHRYSVMSKYNENMRLRVEDALKVVSDILRKNEIKFSDAINEYFETGIVSTYPVLSDILNQYSSELISQNLVVNNGIYTLNDKVYIPDTIKLIKGKDKSNARFNNNEVIAREAMDDIQIVDVSETKELSEDLLQRKINLVINEDSITIDGETISIEFIKEYVDKSYKFEKLLRKKTYNNDFDKLSIPMDKIVKAIKVLEDKGIIEVNNQVIKNIIDLYSKVKSDEMIFNFEDAMKNKSEPIILPKEIVEKYGTEFINNIKHSQSLHKVPEVDSSKLREFANEKVISNKYGIYKGMLVEFVDELREDVIEKSVPIEELLQNSDDTDDREVSVPKVVG